MLNFWKLLFDQLQLHTCEHGERARRSQCRAESSYLNHKLLTNPWPCVKKDKNKLQPLINVIALNTVPPGTGE